MTKFAEAQNFADYVNSSDAPQEMKDAALALADKIDEASFREHVGTQAGLNSVALIFGAIVEAALMGEQAVRFNGARHDGATKILKAIA